LKETGKFGRYELTSNCSSGFDALRLYHLARGERDECNTMYLSPHIEVNLGMIFDNTQDWLRGRSFEIAIVVKERVRAWEDVMCGLINGLLVI
jgi:hypothetical protein